jgi:branched-chain amino acid aminotransferase
MADIFYVDGAFVEAKDAALPVKDLAILRGYGVFDYLRTYRGEPFMLEAHVERLLKSAGEIGLEVPWDAEAIIDIVHQTLKRNFQAGERPRESNIRMIITGGDSPDNLTPAGQPRLVVMVTEAVPPPDHQYIEGVKIITVHMARYLPQAKSLDYIPGIRALARARELDAVEAIYVDSASHALEGTTTNLFAFFGETLITPDSGILPGITRSVVLQLAQDLFKVQQSPIVVHDLYHADEIFITASNKQIIPVIQIDDAVVGLGRPGNRTRRIMELFGDYTGVPLPLPVIDR